MFDSLEKFTRGQELVDLALDLQREGAKLQSLAEAIRNLEDEPLLQVGMQLVLVRVAVAAIQTRFTAAVAKLETDVTD
jgi:chloramphenicol 3-O-phosphotransferase